jgi:hypothetical protein
MQIWHKHVASYALILLNDGICLPDILPRVRRLCEISNLAEAAEVDGDISPAIALLTLCLSRRLIYEP